MTFLVNIILFILEFLILKTSIFMNLYFASGNLKIGRVQENAERKERRSVVEWWMNLSSLEMRTSNSKLRSKSLLSNYRDLMKTRDNKGFRIQKKITTIICLQISMHKECVTNSTHLAISNFKSMRKICKTKLTNVSRQSLWILQLILRWKLRK